MTEQSEWVTVEQFNFLRNKKHMIGNDCNTRRCNICTCCKNTTSITTISSASQITPQIFKFQHKKR